MTLREELYRTAAKAIGEEIDEERIMTHSLVVDRYLESLCKEEALKGNFVAKAIEFVELSDGSTLSERDIEVFAKRNHLDYYPQNNSNPSLGFENII